MAISDIWDKIVEEFENFISFEWVGDTISSIGEIFSGDFFNFSEFSSAGLIQGIITVVMVIYVLGKMNFITQSPPSLKITYYIFFVFITFIFGYLSGRKIWDS